METSEERESEALLFLANVASQKPVPESRTEPRGERKGFLNFEKEAGRRDGRYKGVSVSLRLLGEEGKKE